jgi:hypothetical protein
MIDRDSLQRTVSSPTTHPRATSGGCSATRTRVQRFRPGVVYVRRRLGQARPPHEQLLGAAPMDTQEGPDATANMARAQEEPRVAESTTLGFVHAVSRTLSPALLQAPSRNPA